MFIWRATYTAVMSSSQGMKAYSIAKEATSGLFATRYDSVSELKVVIDEMLDSQTKLKELKNVEFLGELMNELRLMD